MQEIFEIVISALEAAPIENKHIAKFEELIEKDFKNFCDDEPEQNDVPQLKELEGIVEEMRTIDVCPPLKVKTLGVVAGGFASGKSAFLNSFIDSPKVRLAVGIRPVTAIPTYVMSGDSSKIECISAINHGHFDIALEKQLTHDTLENCNLNLRSIIKHLMVSAPMDGKYFENICLIDTPGYNPSGEAAKKDSDTAFEYIKDAEFLIWMTSLSDGTISKSDLDFIKESKFGKDKDKQLYIVANKADHINPSAMKNILDKFEEILKTFGLNYEGISAYSSTKKEVYEHRKKDIYEFLLSKNKKQSDLYDKFMKKIAKVFQVYKDAIEKDDDEKKKARKIIEILQSNSGFDEESDSIDEHLEELKKHFICEPREKRLDRVETIRQKFKDCLHDFCSQAGIKIVNMKPRDETQISKQDDDFEDFKPLKKKVDSPYKYTPCSNCIGRFSCSPKIKAIRLQARRSRRSIQFGALLFSRRRRSRR
jgi:hypothetical protein